MCRSNSYNQQYRKKVEQIIIEGVRCTPETSRFSKWTPVYFPVCCPTLQLNYIFGTFDFMEASHLNSKPGIVI